jgi:hypothetical protein
MDGSGERRRGADSGQSDQRKRDWKNSLCVCHLRISKICMKYLLNGQHSNDVAYIYDRSAGKLAVAAQVFSELRNELNRNIYRISGVFTSLDQWPNPGFALRSTQRRYKPSRTTRGPLSPEIQTWWTFANLTQYGNGSALAHLRPVTRERG